MDTTAVQYPSVLGAMGTEGAIQRSTFTSVVVGPEAL